MNRFLPRWAAVKPPSKDLSVTLLAVVIGVLIIGLFILEIQVPVGVEVWLPNVAVVLLSLWFPHRWQTYLTTAICSVLTVLGMFFSPYIVPTWVAGVNRALGIMMFWITAWMGLGTRRTTELEGMNLRLRLEIAERQRGEEKLAEQASLLDLAQDAILVRDMSDHILFWNRGAQRLYGWTAEEALGKNAIELLLQSRLPGVGEAQQELLKKGKWIGALRQITKDRKNIVVESRWTLVRDREGIPQSVLIVNTDMTEKLTLESQLLRTQRLESIGVLAGGVAHDFNNLLTPILMAVKLLREERPEDERQRLLTTLQASAERGAEMVRKLLSFAGGGETAMEPVHLRYVVREVKSILDHSFPKDIRIETTLENALLPIRADTTQLSQVLMNLCVNARDAMPGGGVLSIRAKNTTVDAETAHRHGGARHGPHVCLTVADTGSGIPPEIIDRIFDPFYTTKEHGKGSGLGLSTVLGIVKSHGGFVDVQSEIGTGSRFSVYLPSTPETVMAADAPSPLPFNPPRGHGEVILIVDDESSILETAQATLEHLGYRVRTAADGREAVECYRQHGAEIRAVVLDMMMPGMDGHTAMDALRELDPRVAIVASSGLRPTGKVAEAVRAGEMDFLQKPYSNDALLSALQRTLQRPERSPWPTS